MKWTIQPIGKPDTYIAFGSSNKYAETTNDKKKAWIFSDESMAWAYCDKLNMTGGEFKKEWNVEPYWENDAAKHMKITGKGKRLYALISQLSKLPDFDIELMFNVKYLESVMSGKEAVEAVELLEDMGMVESHWE